MPAVVDVEKCAGCCDCVEACPAECISMQDCLAVVDAVLCGECGACEAACPTEAITLD